MKIILLFIKSSLWRFLIAILTSTVSGLTLPLILKLITEGIDDRMANSDELIPKFIGALVLYIVTGVTSSYFITYLSQDMVNQLRLNLSDKILHTPYQKLERQTKRLFTILTEDINVISNIVNRLPTIITSIATVIGCFVYMAYISWQLFLMFASVFLVAFIIYRVPLNLYSEKLRAVRNAQNTLFGHFEGLIYGLKELMLNRNFRDI